MEIDGLDKGRSYPILVNWNGTNLRKRQKIEVDKKNFGSGSLRGPIPLPQAEIIGSSNLRVSPSVAVVESSESSLQSRMLKISREISKKAKFLKAMLEEASNEERASLVFRECVLRCADISSVPLALNYDGSSDIVRRTGEGTTATDCGQLHEKGSPVGEDTAVDDVDSEETMSAELDTELTAQEDNDDEFTSDEETDEENIGDCLDSVAENEKETVDEFLLVAEHEKENMGGGLDNVAETENEKVDGVPVVAETEKQNAETDIIPVCIAPREETPVINPEVGESCEPVKVAMGCNVTETATVESPHVLRAEE